MRNPGIFENFRIFRLFLRLAFWALCQFRFDIIAQSDLSSFFHYEIGCLVIFALRIWGISSDLRWIFPNFPRISRKNRQKSLETHTTYTFVIFSLADIADYIANGLENVQKRDFSKVCRDDSKILLFEKKILASRRIFWRNSSRWRLENPPFQRIFYVFYLFHLFFLLFPA